MRIKYGLRFPGARDLKILAFGLFFKACMLAGLFVNSNSLNCLRAANLAFVSFVLAVFRAEEIIASLETPLRLPDWALLEDVFFTIVFFADLGGIRLIGELLSNEAAVGLVEGPEFSMSVDVSCSGIVRVVYPGAVEGPGAPVSWVASDWTFVIVRVLSGKQNFSIWRLFLLCILRKS